MNSKYILIQQKGTKSVWEWLYRNFRNALADGRQNHLYYAAYGHEWAVIRIKDGVVIAQSEGYQHENP